MQDELLITMASAMGMKTLLEILAEKSLKAAKNPSEENLNQVSLSSSMVMAKRRVTDVGLEKALQEIRDVRMMWDMNETINNIHNGNQQKTEE